MLKGHVFTGQTFRSQIFALFINTFLNGQNGVSTNYKNGMEITYSGSTLTVQSGAVCVQGRLLEEDTSTDIATGTDNAYCKLVLEIDLDKQNTETEFTQATYKIIKGTNSYPELTQTNTVKNNTGVYQYELARFRTTSSGITDFQDVRTFLDFESIYVELKKQFENLKTDFQAGYVESLKQLQEKITNIENGSEYVLRNKFKVIEFRSENGGDITVNYPDGFNADNTIVIGIKRKLDNNVTWSTVYNFDTLTHIQLLEEGMLINSAVYKSNYKITLMKND